MVLTHVKSYCTLFMGLWFVSLETFPGSAQWAGLRVRWLGQWRPPESCVTQSSLWWVSAANRSQSLEGAPNN